VRLLAYNVWTWIAGSYQRGLLDPVTSYKVPGRWFSPAWRKGHWDGVHRYVKRHRKTGQYYFPTGFLSRVTNFLTQQGVAYQLEDWQTFEPVEGACYQLAGNNGAQICLDDGKYDYQAEIVDACLAHGRGIVHAATGAGKTEIAAAVIKSIDRPTVFFTDSRHLMYQTRDRLETRLQRPVVLLGDGHRAAADDEVVVAMIQTCARRKFDEFLRSRQLVFGDEIHRMEADQWYDNFTACPAPFRFGLSATPNLELEGMNLLAMTGDVIYRLSQQELIDRGVSVPPRLWFATLDSPTLPKKTPWQTVYKELIVDNEARNQLFCDFCTQLVADKKSALMLVTRKRHGRILKSLLEGQGVATKFIFGDVPQAEREQTFEALFAGRLQVVVSIASIVGAGTDLPPLRAIVNATGGRGGGDATQIENTGRDTVQFIGRGCRSYPGKTHFDYCDVLDKTHEFLSDASLDRLRTLRAEGYDQYIDKWENYRP